MNEKHKLMKPKDPARIGRQASQRAKKWQSRLSAALLCTLLFTVFFPSCKDEDLVPTMYSRAESTANSRASLGTSSGLVENEDGTWTAQCRVPLVGKGRVINVCSQALVSVGGYASGADAMVDLDLENNFEPASVIGAQIAVNDIASIRDLNYEYAGGQKAGFVIERPEGGLLDLSVFEGFWIKTYLKGQERDKVQIETSSSLLDLTIGNITGGNTQSTFVVEGTFSQSFDEVRLGVGTVVDASVLSSVKVRYAYVGENPIMPAVNNGNDYFKNPVTAPTGIDWASYADVSLKKLVNEDTSDGVMTSFLIIGLFQPYLTVDFGRDVPAGSEVGFYITSGTAANVAIADVTTITAYDDSGNETNDTYSSADVVGLNVLGGSATYFGMTLKEDCRRLKISFNGLKILDGGVTVVHYAYVREETKIDASSYFTLSNATVYNPAYRFADLPADAPGTVKYELFQKPNNAPEDVKITQNEAGWILEGMSVAGDYVVKGYYYPNGEDEEPIIRYATITRLVRDSSTCSDALVNENETDKTYQAYIPDGFDGVIQIGAKYDEGDLDAVIDKDISDCFTMGEASINVAQDCGIIGVKKTNGYINSSGKELVRVGFVIDRKQTVLGADILNFLRIKLLKGDNEVESQVGNANDGVSLSLIGVSSSGQARLSIETDEEFDRIELYSSGLVNIDLGSDLKIYYAFCERVEDECGEPGEECMQLITNANFGAVATVYDLGAVSAVSIFQNIGNIVDSDKESFATLFNTLEVGTDLRLSVKFDKILGGQEAGFIFSGIKGLIDLSVIGIEKISALYNGEEVGGVISSGEAVGLKVAGDGDKTYLSITPKSDFDELRIEFGKGVGALENINFHGLYIRPDFDRDGVMDCIGDDASTIVTGLYAEPADICEGDATTFRVDGGIVGNEYILTFNTYKTEKEAPQTAKVEINSYGRLTFLEGYETIIANLPPDEYYINITPVNASDPEFINAELTVHPDETTWKGGVTGRETSWNEWDNWTRGTPWTCTNVIIPSRQNSPTYSNWNGNYPCIINGDVAKCNNIHFEPGAELIGQQYLDYRGQVFIDLKLEAGHYHLLSAPLQGMVTGDMFVLEKGDGDMQRNKWASTWRNIYDENIHIHPNYFTPLDEDNAHGSYLEHRVEPFVYQRFWSKTVSNVTMSRALTENGYNTDDPAINNAEILTTDWSRSFNAVGTYYESGQGFALKVQKDSNSDEDFYEFHFPKIHDLYKYYTSDGQETGMSENLPRVNLNPGKFVLSNQIVLGREEGGAGKIFLFGNPLMASINIQKFMNGNPSIQNVKVYQYKEGNTGQYITISKDGTSTISNPPTVIAPMQAVFVEIGTSSETCSITLTDDMTMPDYVSQTSAAAPNQLRLTATSRGRSASCVVVPSSVASDDYDAREDATLLVGSEEGSGVAVYTVAGGKALSIQRMNRLKRIPVGFYLKEEGSVSLSFDPQGDAWQGWTLVDSQTGKRYPLDSEISLGTVKSGAGRFYLERTGN